MFGLDLDQVSTHIKDTWDQATKVMSRQSLPFSRADNSDLREYIKKAAWHDLANITKNYLLIYWEESWQVMSDLTPMGHRITEKQLAKLISYGREPGVIVDDLIMYQIEGLCLPRLKSE